MFVAVTSLSLSKGSPGVYLPYLFFIKLQNSKNSGNLFFNLNNLPYLHPLLIARLNIEPEDVNPQLFFESLSQSRCQQMRGMFLQKNLYSDRIKELYL